MRFIRNFGKAAAYMAGFRKARGEILVTLDADLQDDPAAIPQFLELIESGSDLVGGYKIGWMANEPLKTLPSKVFGLLVKLAFGMKFKDMNCGFRVMRARVAKSMNLYGGLYRFIPLLAFLHGFKVAECGYNHRKRQYGKTKYGIARFWTGFLDLITVFFITRYSTQRPMHFFGTVALVPSLLGFGIESWVFVNKYFFGSNFQSHLAAIIIGVMLILIGFQCMITGLVGDMLTSRYNTKNYLTTRICRREARFLFAYSARGFFGLVRFACPAEKSPSVNLWGPGTPFGTKATWSPRKTVWLTG